MSIRFPLSGVANGRLSAARMGTLTPRMIRARRRMAAWLTVMIGLLWRGWSDEYGAAGDVDDHAGDPGGLVGGEERGGRRDVLRCAEPFEGVRLGERRLQLGRDLVLVALGEDRLRGDAVGPDPERARLGGDVLCQQRDARLGRRVGNGGAGVGAA